MSFSYTPSATPDDATRVRFHTGDTVEGQNFLSDEDIVMLLAEAGSWQAAVVGGFKFIIARLSQPNFKADWLQIDHASARKGYEGLLAQKRQEFGIPAITASAVHVRRYDTQVCASDAYEDAYEDYD